MAVAATLSVASADPAMHRRYHTFRTPTQPQWSVTRLAVLRTSCSGTSPFIDPLPLSRWAHRHGLVLCGAQVRIVPLPGKRVEHQGIKVQLIGQIELAAERNAVRSNPHDFVSLGA